MHEIIAKMDGAQIAWLIVVLSLIGAFTLTSIVRNLSRIGQSLPPKEREVTHEDDQAGADGSDQFPGVNRLR